MNQSEIEKTSLMEIPTLEPYSLAPYTRLGMFGLTKIRVAPRPRINPPTAISLAFNMDARKERRLKSALCRTVVGFKPPRRWGGAPLSLLEYTITVNYVSEGEVANLIRGYIELKGAKIRFSGVAYGRFGGQNFSPQFSEAARKRLEALTGDFPGFEEDVQQRLMRGEFEAIPGNGETHAHRHMSS